LKENNEERAVMQIGLFGRDHYRWVQLLEFLVNCLLSASFYSVILYTTYFGILISAGYEKRSVKANVDRIVGETIGEIRPFLSDTVIAQLRASLEGGGVRGGGGGADARVEASNENVMESAKWYVVIVAGCGIAAAGLLYLLMGWVGRRSRPAVLPEGMDGAGARVHQSAWTLLFENVLNSGCLLLVQFLFIELFASRWQTLDAYEARRVVLDELIKYQASAPAL
jgi:hypothetical protein